MFINQMYRHLVIIYPELLTFRW